ncbi:sensor histidine kinase [Lacrimispora brassicae]
MQLLRVALLLSIYDIFILIYFKQVFRRKRNHWLFYIVAVVIDVGTTLPFYLIENDLFTILNMMISFMLIAYLFFYVNDIQMIYAGSIYVFSLYSSRGIVSSILSVILHTTISDILKNEISHDIVLALAIFLSILINLFIRKAVVPDNNAGNLIDNKEQLRFVVIYLVSNLALLVVLNNGSYYMEIKQSWFSILYLMACIVSKLWLIFVFDHTTKVSELLKYELYARKLQEQLSRQMVHYQSNKKFTESFRVFRHDYKRIMTSVRFLLQNREYEKATQVLDDVSNSMQQKLLSHKSYSNNVLLDAMIQDAARICEEKGISFSAQAYLSEKSQMSDLDIVCVFSNAIDNAIEACSKILGQDQFIRIMSSGTSEWDTIEIVNSFNGELAGAGKRPETTKRNKDFHGLGLRIIEEIIENLGGVLYIEPDQTAKIFKIVMCIPKALGLYKNS